MSSPRDTLDDVRFSELVSEGSDIPAVADRLKSIAAAEREMGRGDDRRRTTRTESAERRCVPDAVRYREGSGSPICTNAKIARTNTRETFTTGW